MTRICIAGLTGWTGRAIAAAALDAADITLVSGVARRSAGQDAALAIGRDAPVGAPVHASLADALSGAAFDVLIDYTTPTQVKGHILAAIEAGRHAVVGTSGLTAADYAEIDAAARAAGVGVLASGNFALTAALATRFSLMAAKYLDHFEVIDYAKTTKPDAPSGTARELAERLGAIRQPVLGHPLDQIIGERELRGGTIKGVQVHSIRLPGYSASITTEFATEGSRLTITHDAGRDAAIYAEGTLLAARKVGGITGLLRGLDNLLEF
jgi:4-hydroxy-tetrahydrodipicolinate reductase